LTRLLNPFNNTTSIAITCLQTRTTHTSTFYASNGALLKTVKLSGGGNGTISVKASDLPLGAYRYSLIIDGKVVESKQMVQAK